MSKYRPSWDVPRDAVVLVVLIDAIATGCSVFAVLKSSVTSADLLRFGLLVTLSVVYTEVTRQVEFQRRLIADGSSHVDVSSAWTFAGVLILPTSLAVILAITCFAHPWIRSWSQVGGGRLYRVVYSTAAVTLSCFAVSTAIRHLDPRGVVSSSPIEALGLIALAVALYRLTNRTIVAAAVIASARSATRSDLFGRRSVNALEFSTLALGAVMAGCVARQPWFAVMVLPAVFLLQHHDLLKQLVAAATTDAKTELLNAAAWHKLAGRELGRAERRDETAAVLIVDMDHFKRINDTHGHVVGDHVLRAVGKALADELRGYDAVGRFGGEEFVAMLPDVGTDSAPRVAERVRRRIESLHVPGGARDPDELRLSASVGVALYPYHGTQLDTLIECADEALYLAKDAGRNTVCVAPLGAAVG